MKWHHLIEKCWEHRLRNEGEKLGVGRVVSLRKKRHKNIILVGRKINFLGKCK